MTVRDKLQKKISELEVDVAHQSHLLTIFATHFTTRLTEEQHDVISKEVKNINERKKSAESEIKHLSDELKTVENHYRNAVKRSRIIIICMLVGMSVSTITILALSFNKIDNMLFEFLPLAVLISLQVVVMVFMELNSSDKVKNIVYLFIIIFISIAVVVILRSPISGILIYSITVISLIKNIVDVSKWSKKN